MMGETLTKGWSEYLEHDPDFQKEFYNIFNEPSFPQADYDFTPYKYDDTYLNMEHATPKDGDLPEFLR